MSYLRNIANMTRKVTPASNSYEFTEEDNAERDYTEDFTLEGSEFGLMDEDQNDLSDAPDFNETIEHIEEPISELGSINVVNYTSNIVEDPVETFDYMESLEKGYRELNQSNLLKPILEQKTKLVEVDDNLDPEELKTTTSKVLEQLIISIINLHQIPNVSLSTFGASGAVYKPIELELIEFPGGHRFAGIQLKSIDKLRLFSDLRDILTKSSSSSVTIPAIQKVEYEGIIYSYLVASVDILKEFASIVGVKVLIPSNELNLNELKFVIQKC